MPRPYVLVATLLAVATLACSGLTRDGGVCLPNNMDGQAWAYVNQGQLVAPDEKLLAYYDATVSLDGSELALLTDKRAIYHLDGRTTAMAWSEITRIERIEATLADAFLLTGEGGQSMKFEIAVLNGADTWERVQMQAWQAAGGGGAPE